MRYAYDQLSFPTTTFPQGFCLGIKLEQNMAKYYFLYPVRYFSQLGSVSGLTLPSNVLASA
jgi:hypothetical protein